MKALSKIKKSPLFSSKIFRGLKNLSFMTVGNITGTIINFIGLIFIARWAGPSEYGIYSLVGAFTGLFAFFTLGGFGTVLVREGSKDLSNMNKLLERTVAFKMIFGLIAMGVCIFALIFAGYSLQIKILIILFSSELFFTGINRFLHSIFQASEKMEYIAIVSILTHVFFVIFALPVVYLGFGAFGLLVVQLCSLIFQNISNFYYSKKIISFNFFSGFQVPKDLLKPALTFSFLGIMAFLTTRIDLVMISLFFPLAIVGQYAIAYKMTRSAIMLRSLTTTAFLPIAVKTFQKRKVSGRRFLMYSFYFGIGLFIISAIISFFAEDIIFLLFGSAYKLSGDVLKVLIFWLALSFFTIPLDVAMNATHNESIALKLNPISVVMNIGLNYILLLQFGVIGIAYSTLITKIVGISFKTPILYKKLQKDGYFK